MEYQDSGEAGEALGKSVVALVDSVFAVGSLEHGGGRGRVSLSNPQNGEFSKIGELEGEQDALERSTV